MFWKKKESYEVSIHPKVDDLVDCIRKTSIAFQEAYVAVHELIKESAYNRRNKIGVTNIDALNMYASNVFFFAAFSNAVHGWAAIVMDLQKEIKSLDALMEREISDINKLITRPALPDDHREALIETIKEIEKQRKILKEMDAFSDQFNVTLRYKDLSKVETEG